MKIRDIILGILCVSLVTSLGFNYMLWKTKENLSLANEKVLNEHELRSAGMEYDLILKAEYIVELQQELESLELQLSLRDELIKEMNGEKFGASEFGTERDNQEIILSELGGDMEVALDCGARVDLVFQDENAKGPSMRAVEIDWANKWAEGVGQAIYYTVKLNEPVINGARRSDGPLNADNVKKLHMPVVILLAKGADSGWEKHRDRAELCERNVLGMRVWVFDAETKTWLDRE